ncbi:MAG TPA: hypothetical protein VEX60_02600 [Pyrinomonadaceae bacterium]|nr:hypothetical protein [Pyrinomonadaceae bacterium]
MIKVILTLVSLIVITSATAPCAAQGQGQKKAVQPAATKTDTRTATEQLNLSEAEERLVRGSKDAVVAAGISEAYFDEHFTLFRVFNSPGDRRVVWRFRVGGHEALVSDTVGFYTGANGARVDTHSIASALSSAHDITRTITRRRAERIMRSCIGPFNGGAVVYHATGVPGRASLVFTATSVPRRKSRAELAREKREREKRAEREREERERAAKQRGQTAPPQLDVLEEEDEGGGPPIFIGAVDLETGRCTKGRAQAGPPRPEK